MKHFGISITVAVLIVGMAVFTSEAFGFQTPGVEIEEQQTLCNYSTRIDLIATGKVQRPLWVVDPLVKKAEYERWAATLETPDLANAPKPSKFVTGLLYTFEASSVEFSADGVKDGSKFFVYIEGYPIIFHSPLPYLSQDNSYLLLLSAFDQSLIANNARVFNPWIRDAKETEFPDGKIFELARGGRSFFVKGDENKSLVENAHQKLSECRSNP